MDYKTLTREELVELISRLQKKALEVSHYADFMNFNVWDETTEELKAKADELMETFYK